MVENDVNFLSNLFRQTFLRASYIYIGEGSLWKCKQGILNGDVSLYHWPPVWLVWNQLYDNWQFLFLFFFVFIFLTIISQTGGQWYSDASPISIPWCKWLRQWKCHKYKFNMQLMLWFVHKLVVFWCNTIGTSKPYILLA